MVLSGAQGPPACSGRNCWRRPSTPTSAAALTPSPREAVLLEAVTSALALPEEGEAGAGPLWPAGGAGALLGAPHGGGLPGGV